MSIAVTSHVGRDLLQNAAYFNSAPKVVMEYVSNSIDNGPEGQTIRVDVEIGQDGITITDNASGMSQKDLVHFFTMHGVNRQRKRGRKVRGRFGTGKSAAFGIADGLRVETVRDGKRNILQLHRQRILGSMDGGAIPVEHLMTDEKTDAPNGTQIIVYDLQLDRIFITPVRERLERALGRHLDRHEVYINGRRLKYRRPDSVGTFEFEPSQEILDMMPNTGTLKISVSREALTSIENGVAILSNGFLNAMTLGDAAGKAYTERIFGEVEAPDLDDEHDDEHFPAFDNTRDLSLNQQNPRAAMIIEWLSNSVEEVRKELDIEAQLARLSEINSQMQDAADFVGELINADFARVQRRLQVASQHAVEAHSIQSSEIVEVEIERPQPQAEDQPVAQVEPESEVAPPPIEIDYTTPDEPDAQPIAFAEPEIPTLAEDTTADEAYEKFVEYVAELDQAEEKAYFEAVIEEAQAMTTPEERREIIKEVLTGNDPTPLISGNGKHPATAYFAEQEETPPSYQSVAEAYPSEPKYQTQTQHVLSDHEVLLTNHAETLQGNGNGTTEERWVVDRESFERGSFQKPDDSTLKEAARKYKKPRRRTYFHIQFEHMGENAPRSRYAEEGRTIYINRDHPQIIHVEENEGVESTSYKNMMNEIVIQEYASTVVKQMASTGFYVADPFDAIETIQTVVNRLAFEAGSRLRESVAEDVEDIENTEDDDE